LYPIPQQASARSRRARRASTSAVVRSARTGSPSRRAFRCFPPVTPPPTPRGRAPSSRTMLHTLLPRGARGWRPAPDGASHPSVHGPVETRREGGGGAGCRQVPDRAKTEQKQVDDVTEPSLRRLPCASRGRRMCGFGGGEQPGGLGARPRILDDGGGSTGCRCSASRKADPYVYRSRVIYRALLQLSLVITV
jgi:hypothetical protein